MGKSLAEVKFRLLWVECFTKAKARHVLPLVTRLQMVPGADSTPAPTSPYKGAPRGQESRMNIQLSQAEEKR